MSKSDKKGGGDGLKHFDAAKEVAFLIIKDIFKKCFTFLRKK